KVLDEQMVMARVTTEDRLPQTLNALQKQLGAEGLPLRAKRRGQQAIAELQAKHKAWEKSQRASAGSGIDPSAAADRLLGDATALGPGKLVVGEIAGASDEELRGAMDSLKKRAGSYAIMLGA